MMDRDIQDTAAAVLAERGPLAARELWPLVVAAYPPLAQRYSKPLMGLAQILLRDRTRRFVIDRETRVWHLAVAGAA